MRVAKYAQADWVPRQVDELVQWPLGCGLIDGQRRSMGIPAHVAQRLTRAIGNSRFAILATQLRKLLSPAPLFVRQSAEPALEGRHSVLRPGEPVRELEHEIEQHLGIAGLD